jgi:hypothetical protein
MGVNLDLALDAPDTCWTQCPIRGRVSALIWSGARFADCRWPAELLARPTILGRSRGPVGGRCRSPWRKGAACRRSELVALTVADLVEGPDGYRVMIHHSKTDQEGVGQEIARLPDRSC